MSAVLFDFWTLCLAAIMALWLIYGGSLTIAVLLH
jgi:hypothetical protein